MSKPFVGAVSSLGVVFGASWLWKVAGTTNVPLAAPVYRDSFPVEFARDVDVDNAMFTFHSLNWDMDRESNIINIYLSWDQFYKDFDTHYISDAWGFRKVDDGCKIHPETWCSDITTTIIRVHNRN